MTSDGREIFPNPDRTTTILGSFRTDMRYVIKGQLDAPLGDVDLGPSRPGSFNVLNVPDGTIHRLGEERFWREVNQPFLDAAIARGDDIRLATKPEPSVLVRADGGPTAFARELKHLQDHGYRYDTASNAMVRD